MSEFNVGDKVYLEGKISEYDASDNTYCVDYSDYYKETHSTVWVKTAVLHPPDDAYNKGLNDAWELAKKIVINSDDGGYTANELEEMFRTIFPDEVFADFTPQEALAKVKAYEEERNEIKVGDVIRLKGTGNESIVTRVTEISLYFLFKDGSCGSLFAKEEFVKTGHFDSIDEFMRSTDD